MVELERARLAGPGNVEVRQLDAAAIDEPDGAFDAVVFRMGPMLLADPEVGFEQMRRVLAPDGVLAAAVWGPAEDNPWLTALGMAAMMHGAVRGGPPVGPGTPFSLADAAELEKRVRGAGFPDVRVASVRSTRLVADAQEQFAMASVLAPPLAAALDAAPADVRARVQDAFAALVEPHRRADGLHLPVHALAVIARR
jgi:SAM-dependent methyltransferase